MFDVDTYKLISTWSGIYITMNWVDIE